MSLDVRRVVGITTVLTLLVASYMVTSSVPARATWSCPIATYDHAVRDGDPQPGVRVIYDGAVSVRAVYEANNDGTTRMVSWESSTDIAVTVIRGRNAVYELSGGTSGGGFVVPDGTTIHHVAWCYNTTDGSPPTTTEPPGDSTTTSMGTTTTTEGGTTTTTQPAPEPTTTTTQPAPEPTTTTTQPAPEPTTTTTQPAPEPTTTTTQPAPQPTTTTTQPAPQPTTTTTQPAPEPTTTTTTVADPADPEDLDPDPEDPEPDDPEPVEDTAEPDAPEFVNDAEDERGNEQSGDSDMRAASGDTNDPFTGQTGEPATADPVAISAPMDGPAPLLAVEWFSRMSPDQRVLTALGFGLGSLLSAMGLVKSRGARKP